MDGRQDRRHAWNAHLPAVGMAGELHGEAGRRLVGIVRLMDEQELKGIFRDVFERLRGVLQIVAAVLQTYDPDVLSLAQRSGSVSQHGYAVLNQAFLNVSGISRPGIMVAQYGEGAARSFSQRAE